MLNEHWLIDDCLLNRWSIIALNNRYIVNNSASLALHMQLVQRVFYCARRWCHRGSGGIYCAVCTSAPSMAMFRTTHSLTLRNYTYYWRRLTTARCRGTSSMLRTWTVNRGLAVRMLTSIDRNDSRHLFLRLQIKILEVEYWEMISWTKSKLCRQKGHSHYVWRSTITSSAVRPSTAMF